MLENIVHGIGIFFLAMFVADVLDKVFCRYPTHYYALAVSGIGYKNAKFVDKVGKRVFVLPFLQRADRVNVFALDDLWRHNISLVKTKDDVELSTICFTKVKRLCGEEATKRFIDSFSNLDNEKTHDMVHEILRTHLNNAVANVYSKDMASGNHKAFVDNVTENANEELAEYGLAISSISVCGVALYDDAYGHFYNVEYNYCATEEV